MHCSGNMAHGFHQILKENLEAQKADNHCPPQDCGAPSVVTHLTGEKNNFTNDSNIPKCTINTFLSFTKGFKSLRMSSLVAQQVKDPVLSLLWLRLLCCLGTIPGLGTSTCHRHSQKKKA